MYVCLQFVKPIEEREKSNETLIPSSLVLVTELAVSTRMEWTSSREITAMAGNAERIHQSRLGRCGPGPTRDRQLHLSANHARFYFG